jgi:hypothetical protein
MIELLWLMVALEEGRVVAAGALLALLAYTHLGLPLVALVMMVGQAALRGRRAWAVLARAAWGLALAVPWWLHLAGARPGLQVAARLENEGIELAPAMLAAAAVGLWRCWRMRGRLAWPAACWAGFLVLAPRHLYRWISGEGMLPVILLGGVGIEWLAARWPPGSRAERAGGAGARRALGGVTAAAVLLLAPSLVATGSQWQWRWPDAAPWHLTGAPFVVRNARDASLMSPRVAQLAERAAAHTQPDEILWSNAPYALGLIAALARRPMSSAMLNEVGPARPFDPIAAAQLVVFFNVGDPPGWVSQADLRRYDLMPVDEDELAVLYRQAGVAQRAHPPKAVLPLAAALAGLAAALALIVWDFGRTRQPGAIQL